MAVAEHWPYEYLDIIVFDRMGSQYELQYLIQSSTVRPYHCAAPVLFSFGRVTKPLTMEAI